MPKREDISSILIIGAGPIVIGQACEFDYSGVQACKALREEGYRVILINSNPATIMTDPDTADVTYIEPIDWEHVEKIIAKERPDALLPTMGGQTALNCALDLDRLGILEKYGVEMIGATKEAIDKAEDRERFRKAMDRIGLDTVPGTIARDMEQAFAVLEEIGFPIIIRPSFTMGGSGGGIAYNREEFVEICERGLEASPTRELLIEKSILGWKEYEMEVVRDHDDNCIIICSIENFDPMGVHTGDSITVAPAQTLTDKEYQIMRNASIDVLREIGVDTGGSNVQFAVNPDNGEMIVIEMNPRVSRSSALASKATGFPIARVAAKLAVGFTLDELRNDITGGAIPSSFEPSIDYVVSKVPRFDFEKFTHANTALTTQMKSVGEAMSIGRTFKESIQKALRSLEIGMHGFDQQIDDLEHENARDEIIANIGTPNARRIWWLGDAFRLGLDVDRVFEITAIDRWFLQQVKELIDAEADLAQSELKQLTADKMWRLKRDGFSDIRIASLLGSSEHEVRSHRHALGVRPVYKRVDSCAAEFPTTTAYMYSTYERVCESEPSDKKKIVILGGGPNRIGQGIEFDYCCIHAAFALREAGYETIMVNCNPETVSTDYDTSDRLYFEPLTLEDVSELLHTEKPHGVIVQYGGQTPLKLARALEEAGAPIIGSNSDCIHRAEDRESFQALLTELDLLQPPNRISSDVEEAVGLAEEIGYPIVVRPSYVLGGRAMEIVSSGDELRSWMNRAIEVSNESPILLDRFLDDAIEVDVDAICDGKEVVIGGIMEHIEQAGVHSGDSACSLPPYSLDAELQHELARQTTKMALALGVIGLMNVQFAVRKDKVYVLEVNPRASRTVPFVSKATGRSLAKIAARVMAGQSLQELGVSSLPVPRYFAVKEAVFPFIKFPGVDPILSPEMKSTGEVMGVGSDFGEAFLKSQKATGMSIPEEGAALLSVRDADKEKAVEVARYLQGIGFTLYATGGTQRVIEAVGIPCEGVDKVGQGRPNVVDIIKNNQVNLVINTTQGRKSLADSAQIRRETLNRKITYFTTMAGASAACAAHRVLGREIEVRALQDLHKEVELK